MTPINIIKCFILAIFILWVIYYQLHKNGSSLTSIFATNKIVEGLDEDMIQKQINEAKKKVASAKEQHQQLVGITTSGCSSSSGNIANNCKDKQIKDSKDIISIKDQMLDIYKKRLTCSKKKNCEKKECPVCPTKPGCPAPPPCPTKPGCPPPPTCPPPPPCPTKPGCPPPPTCPVCPVIKDKNGQYVINTNNTTTQKDKFGNIRVICKNKNTTDQQNITPIWKSGVDGEKGTDGSSGTDGTDGTDGATTTNTQTVIKDPVVGYNYMSFDPISECV